MSSIRVKHLRWLAILLGVTLSACHNEDASPSSTPCCAQSISPDHYAIGAADATSFEGGDGSMMLTYSTAPDLDKADVTGGGTTAWPAILTTVCENGTLMLDTTEAAPWWPINPGQTLTATNGVLDGTVSNALANGTIHLDRH
jgi:hypothetical protein